MQGDLLALKALIWADVLSWPSGNAHGGWVKGRLWGQLAAPWLGRQGSLAVGKAMAHPNAVPGADSGSEEG